MKNRKVQDSLDKLWGGDITKLDIDILKQTITFIVELHEKDKKQPIIIQFRGVASFYFVVDNGHRRHQPDKYYEGYRLELSGISVIDNIDRIEILSKKDPEWAEQYFSNANFVLELWFSILLIEANEVLINNELFAVEYPPIT